MKKCIIFLITLILLLLGCSSQQDKQTSNQTQQLSESKYNIREEIKKEIVPLYQMILEKANNHIPTSEEEFAKVEAFVNKYRPNATQDEKNLINALIALDEANLYLVKARLNSDYTEKDKWEKEFSFQLAKIETMLGIE